MAQILISLLLPQGAPGISVRVVALANVLPPGTLFMLLKPMNKPATPSYHIRLSYLMLGYLWTPEVTGKLWCLRCPCQGSELMFESPGQVVQLQTAQPGQGSSSEFMEQLYGRAWERRLRCISPQEREEGRTLLSKGAMLYTIYAGESLLTLAWILK